MVDRDPTGRYLFVEFWSNFWVCFIWSSIIALLGWGVYSFGRVIWLLAEEISNVPPEVQMLGRWSAGFLGVVVVWATIITINHWRWEKQGSQDG